MVPAHARWHPLADRSRLTQACLGLSVVTLALAAQALGAFEPLDRRLLDLYLIARGGREPVAPVVIVGIDYESIQRLGHPWPWPRSVHARLLRQLAAAGADLVAFDVLFVESDPSHDNELAGAAEAMGNVVWASTFGHADEARFRVVEHRAPVPALQVPSAAYGYVDLRFDPDGHVRRVVPFRQFGSRMLQSFAGVVADRHRREPLLALSPAGSRWPGPQGAPVPTERDGSLLIHFAGAPGTFPTLPYVRVLEGAVPAEALRGKIVLVGAILADTDRFFTPFYSRWLPETARPMAGVEIHAHIVDMILTGRFLGRAGWPWQWLVFFGAALAGAQVAGRRVWLALGALVGGLLGCLAAGYLGLVVWERWLPVAGPLLTLPAVWGVLVFRGLLVERGEKDFVRATLERYVSPAVVEEVVARRIDPALGGRRQTVTVLFSDVRGFTGLSERVPPETLVQVLNDFFTAAGEIVLARGGTLDKFIGDAVMAFWGAPIPSEDHALLAVGAALELQAAARRLDARLQAELGERFQIGVGLNTGAAIVGHIGSPRRLGYTVIGDPVNLAARVQGMTREQQADVLITQATYEAVRFDVQAEPLGIVPVRGRKDPVAIHRVLGLKVLGLKALARS